MNDCAADVPPVENLLRPIRRGFDLVVVSGGKAIRGPQSAGILAGRADLIRAARKNTSPNSDTIGRSCKVNKEEMVGMMVALESFIKEDYASTYRGWERTAESIRRAVTKLPGVEAVFRSRDSESVSACPRPMGVSEIYDLGSRADAEAAGWRAIDRVGTRAKRRRDNRDCELDAATR